jgi:hypothetical protein
MPSTSHYLLSLFAIVLICTASASAGIYIDGDTSDWGISVADNNGSDFSSFDPSLTDLISAREDQNDNAGDSGYLGPRQGGQNYDAELLAVVYQNGTLFGLLVTGQRPDNGSARFAPGDFIIETSAGVYGLEFGGGPGGSGGSTPLLDGAQGSTYTMNGNGYTTGHAYAAAQQTAGSIWQNVNWLNGPISPHRPVQFEVTGSSTQVGMADYIYTLNQNTNQHAVIEFGMDPSIFGGETIESITWRPSCDNDELVASPINVVPEPMTAILLGLGAFLLPARRRR